MRILVRDSGPDLASMRKGAAVRPKEGRNYTIDLSRVEKEIAVKPESSASVSSAGRPKHQPGLEPQSYPREPLQSNRIPRLEFGRMVERTFGFEPRKAMQKSVHVPGSAPERTTRPHERADVASMAAHSPSKPKSKKNPTLAFSAPIVEKVRKVESPALKSRASKPAHGAGLLPDVYPKRVISREWIPRLELGRALRHIAGIPPATPTHKELRVPGTFPEESSASETAIARPPRVVEGRAVNPSLLFGSPVPGQNIPPVDPRIIAKVLHNIPPRKRHFKKRRKSARRKRCLKIQ